LLLTCFFRHDTPIFLQEQGDEEGVMAVMRKFYTGVELGRRLDTLKA